jgi:Flp pilus assembly protein TadD
MRKAALAAAFAALCAFLAGCPAKEESKPDPAGKPKPADTATAAPAGDSAKAPVVPTAPSPAAQEISITSTSPEAVAAFKRGRDLVENSRVDEGLKELRDALSSDKKFPLALAYLGFFTPGEEGELMLERAASLSSPLPKAERLFVEHLGTWRQGDASTLYEQRKRLLELAPNDWRVHFELGMAAQSDRNFDKAETELRKAIELNPDATAAFSLLGYTLIGQKKYPDAIAALQEYARRHPSEPSALDTLAEAQLRAGKLADAEASFRAATATQASFWQAWLGLAAARSLQGDQTGAREAATKARGAAKRPEDKLEATHFLIWSFLAEGDRKAALAKVDAYEKEAKASKQGDRWAEAAVLRAAVLAESGKPGQVFDQVATALERGKQSRLFGDPLARLYRLAFVWKVIAESRMGKTKDAEKSLAFLVKTAGISPGPESNSSRSFATGLVSWVKGEKEAAIRQMLECEEEDHLCKLELVRARAATKSEPAKAEAERKALLEANRRDPVYLYVRAAASKVETVAAAKP